MSQKMKEKSKGMEMKAILKVSKQNNKSNRGITLIALVITIVLNCSYLAMEQIKKLKKYRTSCII